MSEGQEVRKTVTNVHKNNVVLLENRTRVHEAPPKRKRKTGGVVYVQRGVVFAFSSMKELKD